MSAECGLEPSSRCRAKKTRGRHARQARGRREEGARKARGRREKGAQRLLAWRPISSTLARSLTERLSPSCHMISLPSGFGPGKVDGPCTARSSLRGVCAGAAPSAGVETTAEESSGGTDICRGGRGSSLGTGAEMLPEPGMRCVGCGLPDATAVPGYGATVVEEGNQTVKLRVYTVQCTPEL